MSVAPYVPAARPSLLATIHDEDRTSFRCPDRDCAWPRRHVVQSSRLPMAVDLDGAFLISLSDGRACRFSLTHRGACLIVSVAYGRSRGAAQPPG